jgi:hypothetical protein
MSDLGFYTIEWVDWWQVLLGLSFVLVTLFAPKGIGGLFDCRLARSPRRRPRPRQARFARRRPRMSTLSRSRRLGSFDGFKAINNLSFEIGGGTARHHRPQRGGQDHLHGHRHRQDPARRGPGALGRASTARCCGCRKARSRGPASAASSSAHRVRGPERARQPDDGAEEDRSPFAVLRYKPPGRMRTGRELAEEIGLGGELTRKAGELSPRAEAMAGNRHAAGPGSAASAGR